MLHIKEIPMFELIAGLKILHSYTENVFICDEFVCVNVENLPISELHERYLASYDWKYIDNVYRFELESGELP